jgi:hypothetical protein
MTIILDVSQEMKSKRLMMITLKIVSVRKTLWSEYSLRERSFSDEFTVRVQDQDQGQCYPRTQLTDHVHWSSRNQEDSCFL